jgi:hydroxymethylpyrimidine pyrophosphatase-like HAD family hydrolase
MERLEVFFDIDGCLVDKEYHLTIPTTELERGVRASSLRMGLHLNSNRSRRSILDIRAQVGFNGLVIYENGQGIFNPTTGEDYTLSKIGKFSRKDLIRKLGQISEQVSFVSTDDLINFPERFSSSLSRVIFCEESREYTATVYPRVIKNGVPTFDKNYLDEAKEFLSKSFGNKYIIRSTPGYGNVVLTPIGALKSGPMKRLFGTNRVASFGDDIPDINMFQESSPTLIGCPANSVQEVKEFVRKNGGFVAGGQYTTGAIEFLNYLNGKLSQ